MSTRVASPVFKVRLLVLLAGIAGCFLSCNGAQAKEDKTIMPQKVSPAVCEGQTMNLSCGNDAELTTSGGDYVLNILPNSMYGRFAIMPCNPNAVMTGWSTKCSMPDALAVVRNLCQGKRACEILASNLTFTARDPCPETSKYLEVGYTCVRKEPPTAAPLSFNQQKLVSPAQPFAVPNNNDFDMPKFIPAAGSSSNGYDFNINNNNMCPETTAEGIVWQQSPRGTVYQKCPNGIDAHAHWVCLDQLVPRWAPSGPDLSLCNGVATGNSQQQFCESNLMGGITWPRTAPGAWSTMPCPMGAKGYMRWRCVIDARSDQIVMVDWDRRGPDASECESSWVQTVDSQRITVDNVLPIIERTAEKTFATVAGDATPIQYGRDLQAVIRHLATVQRTAELGLESGQLSGERIRNLSLALIRASSAVLDARNVDAWRDLRRHDASASATRLLNTLERHASMMTVLSQEPNGLEKMVSKNVFVGSGRFNASVASPIGLVFQPMSRESTEWPGIWDQVQLSRPLLESMQANKTLHLSMLPLSFVAFNNLAQYLGTKLADEQAATSLQQLASRIPMMTTLMPFSSTNNSMLILPNNYPPLYYEPLLVVNSRIISAAVHQQRTPVANAAGVVDQKFKLAEPVIIRLEHLNKEQRGTPMCVYWAYQYGGAGPGYEAAWSRDGCAVLQTSRDFTICSCAHMGSFAVVFDVNGIFTGSGLTADTPGRAANNFVGDARGFSQLTTVTSLGYLLAILCLFLTLVMLNCCYKFGSSRLTKSNGAGQAQQQTENLAADENRLKTFHKHLVFCLLGGHLVFLFTVVDRTYSRTSGACEAAGMFLHWFYLAAFVWMLLQTAHLYTKLTKVFFESAQNNNNNAQSQMRSKKWYFYALAAGYGVPTFAVLLVLAVSGGSWRNYATEQFCFLRIDSLVIVLGFVVPALSALVLTWLLLSICFYILTKKLTPRVGGRNLPTDHHHQAFQQRGMQVIKCWICSTAVLSGLLGAAWIVGLLYLRTDAIALAYLFVVLNSFLGAMVFVLHILRDEKVCRKFQRFSSLRFFFSSSSNSSLPSRWTASAATGGGVSCNAGIPPGSHVAAQWLTNTQQSSPSSAYSSGNGVAGQHHDLHMMKNAAEWPQNAGGTANSDTATMIYGGSMWNNQLADLAGLPPHHPHMHHHQHPHTMCRTQHQQLPPSLLLQQQQRDRDSGVSCPSSQRESPPTMTTAGNGLPVVSSTNCGCCCTSNYCAHVHAAAAAALHHHQHQTSSNAGGECPYRVGGSEAPTHAGMAAGGSMLYSDHEHIYQEIPNHYNTSHHCTGGAVHQPPVPLANSIEEHRVLLMHQQQQVAAAVQAAQRQRQILADQQQQQQVPNENACTDDDEDDEVCSTEPSQSDDESNISSSCEDQNQNQQSLSNNANPIAAAAAARARARAGIAVAAGRPASQRRRSGGAPASAQQQQQQLRKKKSLPLPPTAPSGLPQQQNCLQPNQFRHHAAAHHHQQQNSGGIYQPQSTCSCSSDACSTNNGSAAAAAAAAVAAAATAAARNRFQTAAAAAAANAAAGSRFHSPHRNSIMQQRTTPQHFNSATVNSQHIPACFPLAGGSNAIGGNTNINNAIPDQSDFRQPFIPNNNNSMNNNNPSAFAPLSYANTLPHHAQIPYDAVEQQQQQHYMFNHQNDMMMMNNAPEHRQAAAAHLAHLHHMQQQNRLSAAMSNGTLHQMHPQQQQQAFLSSSTMHLANGLGNHNMSKLALPSVQHRQHNNNINSNGLSFSEC